VSDRMSDEEFESFVSSFECALEGCLCGPIIAEARRVRESEGTPRCCAGTIPPGCRSCSCGNFAIAALAAKDAEIAALEAERDRLRALSVWGTTEPVGPKYDEIERLKEALRQLVDRLDLVHADDRYESVWSISQMYVGPYKGPTYTKELAIARAALKEKP
jgi:hypothetical protein